MLLTLLLSPAYAFATPPRGLPADWSFGETQAGPDNGPRWRYRQPTDRTGTYLHGASREIAEADGWDSTKLPEACIAKPRSYSASQGLPRHEYWYFEANGEGVLLLRSREYSGYDADCNIVIRTTDTVERVLIGEHGFTRFTAKDGGWTAETHHFAAYRRTDTRDIGIGNAWAHPLSYFAVRKRRLRDSKVGPLIGRFQTHCLGYSSPPDAGGYLCWLAGNGPGKGIVTYDLEYIAGGPNLYHQVSEIEDRVRLDGRLFEWDRPIIRR